MILIDSSVFMYAAGAPHPNKESSVALLESIARGTVDAATDAEVLQEILHRYRAIRRWNEGRALYDLVRRIVPNVVPVTAEILDVARVILDTEASIMARDALHAAAARSVRASCICSFDRDFDRIAGVVRREPDSL
jgi:predicted nucleic acid-binding protein